MYLAGEITKISTYLYPKCINCFFCEVLKEEESSNFIKCHKREIEFSVKNIYYTKLRSCFNNKNDVEEIIFKVENEYSEEKLKAILKKIEEKTKSRIVHHTINEKEIKVWLNNYI